MRRAQDGRWLLWGLCLVLSWSALAAPVVQVNPAPRPATATAATEEDPYVVRLESRAFAPKGRADAAGLGDEKVFVQFQRTLTTEEQAALAAAGVVFHESLEPFTYLVSMPRTAAEAVQRDPLFRGAEPIQPTDKLSASIFRNEIPDHALRPGGIGVFFRFYENVTLAEALAALDAAGLAVPDRSGLLFGARLEAAGTRDQIVAACQSAVVRAAFEIPPPPVLHNAQAASISNVPPVQAAPYSLTGSGVSVGIWDGGRVRDTHQALTPRVTVRELFAVDDHATHVCGTIIGSGSGNATAKGMATGATAFSYALYGDAPTEQSNSVRLPPAGDGIAVSNHSWGWPTGWSHGSFISGSFGTYVPYSAPYDLLVRATDLTVVKSVGNDGGECDPNNPSNCDGTLESDGFRYHNVASWSNAKNIVTVGALNDDGVTKVYFSSAGPPNDGRIRPDVVANGVTLTSSSAFSDTAYVVKSGTSMSGPVVTGVVALIDQEWAILHEAKSSVRNKPAPELVKALLINTAADLGRPGPDYAYGHGLVKAKEAIDALKAPNAAGSFSQPPSQHRIGFVSEGETLNYRLSTPAGPTGPLKTTLVWNDLEGTSASVVRYCNFVNFKVPCTSDASCTVINPAASCEPAPCGAVPCDLKNDLEFWMWDSTQTAIIGMPWVGPGAGAVTANAYQGSNRLDNAETIQTSDPVGGNLGITVFGFTVSGGRQRFALVANKPLTFLPANDNFANAKTLPALVPATMAAAGCASGEVPCPGTQYPHNTWEDVNYDATIQVNEPVLGSAHKHSVWFKWVAPSIGIAVFDTAGSDYDTVLGVYTGNTVSTLTTIATNNDFFGRQSRVQFNAVAGATYFIAVSGNQAGVDTSMGVFSLNYHLKGPCGNGTLEAGEACDDGNNAAGDCCSPTCTYESAGGACSDNNACTNGDFCNGTGTCVISSIVVCGDFNSCTTDSCNPATGCEFSPVPSGVACNDGNACTTADICNGSGVCIGGPPPALPAPTVNLTMSNKTTLTWPSVAGAAGYDVVSGSLGLLRSGGGNFTTATTDCLANDQTATTLSQAGVPASGSGFFFLLRGTNCSGSGTYDTTSPKQAGSRDAEVDAAAVSCGTSCSRSHCVEGPVFDASCDACTAAICAIDSFCCNNIWDELCIFRVRTACHSLACPESAGSCGHPVCSVGSALTPGCDEPPFSPSCVTSICNADPFCCENTWDATCVNEVSTYCGNNCAWN